MNPERWKLVDEVLQSALDRTPEERDAFLRGTCGGDQALEREVRSLMLLEKPADRFLSRPALQGAAGLLTQLDDSIAYNPIGGVFGHYRVVEPLGSGGMGVVYKAEDLELKRYVALKFLSDDLARGHESLGRFKREARAASALNHPNICTIYDIGEQDGRAYIVMELLEGVTLKHQISSGRIETGELIRLASGIASGLEAADQAGIIHRDIKPANIFVTKLGHPKILDFGLAKLTQEPAADLSGGAEPVATELTNPGSAMGTVPYMSPEQIRSEVLDPRTDLFSFGVVLYEMTTGVLPFRGSHAAEILRAIAEGISAPVSHLNVEAPPELERIIRRCLEKDREERYQHSAEIRADLLALERGRLEQPTGSGRAGVRRRWWGTWVAALAVLIAAAATAGYFVVRKPAPKLGDRDTVVLADFRNTTGDAVFDGALRQAVSTQLEQSPFLVLVDDRKIKAAIGRMQKPADTKLTPEVAREVCERIGSAAVIEGTIDPVGSQYLLGLTARNCRSGESFYTEQVQAGGKEEVIGALQTMSMKLRQRAGESLASVKQYSTPLDDEATTPSFEALTAYSAGRAAISKGPRTAMEFFKRAVELDPKFASANAFLGTVYASMGDSENGLKYASKAYELRDRASERERYFIAFNYQLRALGNLEQSRETAQLWAQRYPRDVMPESFLSGSVLESLGKYEQAEEHGNRSIELDPDNAYGYHNVANSYICRGRLDEASAVLDRAASRKLDIHEFTALRHQIAFLRGDIEEMARIDALGEEKIGAPDWVFDLEAGALAYRGRLREARVKLQRAISIAAGTGKSFGVAQHQAAFAVREFLFGNPAEARRGVMAVWGTGSTDRDATAGAALTLAFLKDPRAETLLREHERRFPEDTTAQTNYLPALRAQLALNRKDPAKALAVLEANVPYELAWVGSRSTGFAMSLYPLYLRGKAYLALGRPAEAAAEFRKIVDHLGVVSNEPTVAVAARVELARALAAAGDTVKSKATYEEFLGLWKDADADIPLLVAVKTEYAALSSR